MKEKRGVIIALHFTKAPVSEKFLVFYLVSCSLRINLNFGLKSISIVCMKSSFCILKNILDYPFLFICKITTTVSQSKAYKRNQKLILFASKSIKENKKNNITTKTKFIKKLFIYSPP